MATLKLSKEALHALAASGEVYAAPYLALAEGIARSLEATKVQRTALTQVRTTTWDSFKQALSIAATSGHTATALRVGMEIACSEAGIPSGSFRSYVNTIGSLYADIMEGKLTLAAAEVLSVADARARYKVAPELTEKQKAQRELDALVENWQPDEIRAVIAMATTMPAAQRERDRIAAEQAKADEAEAASHAEPERRAA